MATKFSDLSKAPKDLLNDDFTNKISLKCKKNAGPVAVTLEIEKVPAGGLIPKIGTKATVAGLNLDKFQVLADGAYVLETSVPVSPGVTANFKGNKGLDLGIDYTNGKVYGTTVLDVKDLSKLSASACLNVSETVKAGGEATWGLSGKTGFTGINVAASYASGPMLATLTSASSFSQVILHLHYQANPSLTLVSQTTHSSKNPCDAWTVGAKYNASFGVVKAKVGKDGLLSACVTRELVPKVTATASGSVPVSDPKSFTYGIGITF